MCWLTIACLAAIAAVAHSENIRLSTEQFVKSSNSYFRLLPKDIRQLERELKKDSSVKSPLILFIRNAKGVHDTQQYRSAFKRSKQSSPSGKGKVKLSDDARFTYFDPEVDYEGHKQIEMLKQQLQMTGWMDLLDRIKDVQFICSPQSRSIETALQVFPDSKIIIDDNVRPQISPNGVDLRRNFKTPLIIGDEAFESAQTKFKPYKDRLIWQMANRGAKKEYKKFGYISEEDYAVKHPTQESPRQFHDRIVSWLNMLRPLPRLKMVKGINVSLPGKKTKQTPNTTQWPKIYVVFTHESFINGVIEQFSLDTLKQNEDINYCEVVPVMLQFPKKSSRS